LQVSEIWRLEQGICSGDWSRAGLLSWTFLANRYSSRFVTVDTCDWHPPFIGSINRCILQHMYSTVVQIVAQWEKKKL
jgi:hypothetical protein